MLTPAQITTLRAAVAAEPSLSAALASGDDYAVAAWLNANAAPDFSVWKITTSAAEIYDAIVWGNLTPADVPDATQAWANRSLCCQGKQFNIQTMLAGRESISTGKGSIRAGLQDALSNVPSGAGGASQTAGWPAVKAAITGLATRAEKLLATGAGTPANPATLGFEGTVTADEASMMR